MASDFQAKILAKLIEQGRDPFKVRKGTISHQILTAAGVPSSPEFQRIKNLPTRDWQETAEKYAEPLQKMLALPRCNMKLRPWQVAALAEAYEHEGLFVSAGVGAGKTVVSLLIPVVVEAQRPVYMIPAQTRDKTIESDIPALKKQFLLHPHLKIISYESLSHINGVQLLEDLKPDCLILDEAHFLRRKNAARTRRFYRFIKNHPQTNLYVMTGTPAKNGPRDYADLLRLTHPGDHYPLPRTYNELQLWCNALEFDGEDPTDPGVLMEFCEPGEAVYAGWARKMNSIPGIIFTSESSLDKPLIIHKRKTEVPKVIQEELALVQNTWASSDGEMFVTAMDVWRHMREISCGFRYRWVWPEGKKNREWLGARAEWHKFVRDTIKHGHTYDSMLQVTNAVLNGHIDDGGIFEKWKLVEPTYVPMTEALWLDTFLLNDVIKLCQNAAPTLIWVEHRCVGQALAKLTLWPYCGAGVSQNEILAYAGKHVILSSRSHRTGKNLQPWHRNIVVCAADKANAWEQLLGRTHRQGQEAEHVECIVYQHTSAVIESFERAIAGARFIEESTLQVQKLNLATFEEPK